MVTVEKLDYIKISDEVVGYDLKHFCIPKHYEHVLDSVLISNGMIKDRIEKLAQKISEDEDYMNEGITALCVLKGGFKFFADLTNSINQNNQLKSKSIPMVMEFIKVKSYLNEHSTGVIEISGLSDIYSVKNKNILIVEDMIDTGATMLKLITYLKQYEPSSIRCASLLLKRTPHNVGYTPDYVGFEVPEKFLVGYSMDYNERFRDLNHLCIMNENGRIAYKE